MAEQKDVCACGQDYHKICAGCFDGVCEDCARASYEGKRKEGEALHVCKYCSTDGLPPAACKDLLYKLFGDAKRIRTLMDELDIPNRSTPLSYEKAVRAVAEHEAKQERIRVMRAETKRAREAAVDSAPKRAK